MRHLIAVALSILVLALALSGCGSTCANEEANIETIRRIHAEMAAGNANIMDEVLAPDYRRHCQSMPPELWELTDKEVFKGFLDDWLTGVPGYTDSIGPIFASGDMVAYVSTMKGIHSGDMEGLPATGKEFTLVNLVIQRFEDGKVAETWVSWDNVAFLTQIGMFPPPMHVQP